MSEVLFAITSIGIISWILMIFLPQLRFTQNIIKYAIFPIFLSICYIVGLIFYISNNGIGFFMNFTSYTGVINLLKDPDIAIIAWIHVLAFDQLIARMIFMENQENNYFGKFMQGIILFCCLMFGPVGYMIFMTLKMKIKRIKV